MDELGGLIGVLVGIVVVIYIIAWLIAIAAIVAMVAGPPLGLGVLLKRLLTRRYTLSQGKKWQCAGLVALFAALPCLALLADTSWQTCLAVAWAGVVMGLSSMVAFLAISAYQQHFAEPRRVLREARVTERVHRLRRKIAGFNLWRVNRTLRRVESKHGRLLRAQEDLGVQIDALIERNDPALCRIQIGHWENQYAALPPQRLAADLAAVSRDLDTVPATQQPAVKLQALFLESQMVRRKLAGDKTASQFDELKAERDRLQSELTGCADTIAECERVRTEKTTRIAQLKTARLVIQ